MIKKNLQSCICALIAVVAVSVLPGVSASRRTTLSFNTNRVSRQPEGFQVTPTLDAAHAVTQVVPANGGTVTATGADGTKFTLIVPAKALLSSARVTMTPVSMVGGLPLSGGLAAAVQLEPGGLRLFNFATLLIEPPQSLSPNQETSFAWDQDGNDLHLFPMQTPNGTRRENARGIGLPLNPRGLIFKLLHFSGYGVGSGTDGDRAAQRQRQPSGSEARFEQTLEAIIGRERKRQLAIAQSNSEFDLLQAAADDDDDPDYLDEIIQSLKDRYTNDVKPAMDSALLSKDDVQLRCAMLKALGCNRQIELLFDDLELPGKTEKFFKKAKKAISRFMEKALETLADNSSRRCSKDHKPEETIILLGIAHQQLLLHENGFCKCDSSKTQEAAENCAHFELEFDSETELNDPAATVTTRVHATVPIGLKFINAPGDEIPGQAPLGYLSCVWTPKDPDCSATNTTTSTTFRVLSFNIDLNPRSFGDCAAEVPGKVNIVSVDIDPGLPREIVTVRCRRADGTIETTTIPQVIWIGTFGEFHIDETDVTGAIVISDWEAGNGSLLARKTYDRGGFFDGFPMTARTTINLWHRPE